ncbi:MAG: hypothetical protein JNM57_02320 [Cyclobacteriaceae bacterium]|nr:hypothetical protein [Cyclobacteriaceae bacterium]
MSRISNYTELMAERKRVEDEIKFHKQVLRDGVQNLRGKLEPFLYLLPFLNVFKKKTSDHPVLQFISSLGIDLLVGQKLLSKSNWFTRLVVPLFLKGVSAKAIGSLKA